MLVSLKRRKQNGPHPRERFRAHPHEQVNDHLAHGENEQPGHTLTGPVPEPTIVAVVHAAVFQVRPVALVRALVNDAQATHGQYEAQRRVNQITETVPGALK